jgi:hypothetical protein
VVPIVRQTNRLQFGLKPSGESHAADDVETVDLQADVDPIPGQLPPDASIMYVDLTAGQNVHRTRWPNAYRPGFGG